MDTVTNLLLDDGDASLDEVLAFVDSYDFGVSDTWTATSGDRDVAPQFLDDIEIEAILTGQEDDVTMQECTERTSTAQTAMEASHTSRETHRRTPSMELRWLTAPSRERGRVRDRVVRLREVVKQLEQQLQLLSQHSGPHDSNPTEAETPSHESSSNALSETSSGDGDLVTWRQLATRQYAARRAAEKENATLRERLEEQVRVARRLERLIQGQLSEEPTIMQT